MISPCPGEGTADGSHGVFVRSFGELIDVRRVARSGTSMGRDRGHISAESTRVTRETAATIGMVVCHPGDHVDVRAPRCSPPRNTAGTRTARSRPREIDSAALNERSSWRHWPRGLGRGCIEHSRVTATRQSDQPVDAFSSRGHFSRAARANPSEGHIDADHRTHFEVPRQPHHIESRSAR